MKTAILALALLCVGCGGAGGSSPALPTDRASGNWTGTWAESTPGTHHGTLTIAISWTDFNLLGVSGTVSDAERGDGPVTGVLQEESGESEFTYPYTGSEGVGNEIWSGKLHIDGRGHLVGTLSTASMGSSSASAALDLAPVG